MQQYIALIHKEADSDYGISFPDLPGVISAGKTLDEARDMGAEALALHLEGLSADDETAPEPSSLEEIMKEFRTRTALRGSERGDGPEAEVPWQWVSLE
jgi:predicted RNase H-like HicB family nuclease